MMEKTFIMIKPDGVKKRIMGEIISRIERKGYVITRVEIKRISRELAEKHYQEHRGKPFYDSLIEHIISGPSMLMVVEGEGAVCALGKMVGSTDPNKAQPGTIRFDYASTITQNIIHRSDSRESAEREIKLFFK